MKKMMLLAGILSLWMGSSAAAFVSGSTEADGDLVVSNNTTLVLQVREPPNEVFNYRTITIGSGATLTFLRNSKNTPVYMLATREVVINGTISVDGGYNQPNQPGRGGPGGFDGGYAGATGLSGGNGLGPGGGYPSTSYGGGGGFGTVGGSYQAGIGGPAYGNERLLPLIGGSGGGGGSAASYGGGGGGGAIAIASSISISLTGTITAIGGGYTGWDGAGGGSGGAVKLVANSISGNGAITAIGYPYTAAKGGTGRIRLEANVNGRTAATDPPYSYGLPGSVFVANSPTLTITSIAGTNVPAAPTGSYNQPDMPLPSTTTNPVAVNVSAMNIPAGTTVTVWVLPQYGSATSVDTILSGSTATANVTLSTTYANIVTAQATFTVIGMNYNGEEIDKVRVATKLGGKSETTYITKSGKEIKGELVAALMK